MILKSYWLILDQATESTYYVCFVLCTCVLHPPEDSRTFGRGIKNELLCNSCNAWKRITNWLWTTSAIICIHRFFHHVSFASSGEVMTSSKFSWMPGAHARGIGKAASCITRSTLVQPIQSLGPAVGWRAHRSPRNTTTMMLLPARFAMPSLEIQKWRKHMWNGTQIVPTTRRFRVHVDVTSYRCVCACWHC